MIDVAAVQLAASDLGPVGVATLLGFTVGARNHRGKCPIHGGNPGAFALDARGGSIVWKCHVCGIGGDVIELVGELHGLTSFGDKLTRTAELLGVAVETAEPTPEQIAARARAEEAYRAAQVQPERPYPDAGEVCGLWQSCESGAFSAEAIAYLEGRGFDLQTLRELDLVREIPTGTRLPSWARIRGKSWLDAGYRLICCAYDHHGCVRSLRGWRITRCDDGLPKRLAPAGCRVSGLVTANSRGALLLSVPQYFVSLGDPVVVRICEGEPDLVWLSSAFPTDPVFAATSATSWPDEVGDRIPDGSTVAVYPDDDAAGAKLLAAVVKNLGHRCEVLAAKVSSK